jgi:hypothetical protein
MLSVCANLSCWYVSKLVHVSKKLFNGLVMTGHDLTILPVKGPLTEEDIAAAAAARHKHKHGRRGSINLDEQTLAETKRYRTNMIGVVNNSNTKHVGRFRSSREKAPTKADSTKTAAVRNWGSPKHANPHAAAAVPHVQHADTHANTIIPSRFMGHKHQCCQCGIFNSCCKVLPTIPEVNENTGGQVTNAQLFAARKIQKVAHKYIAEKFAARTEKVLRTIRRNAATNHFDKNMMGPVFRKVVLSASTDICMKLFYFVLVNCSYTMLGRCFANRGSVKICSSKTK